MTQDEDLWDNPDAHEKQLRHIAEQVHAWSWNSVWVACAQALSLSLSLSLFPELAQRLKLLNSIDETHHKAFIEREVGLG
jgi:hypothetical protein